MSLSFNEIEAMALKAARGAGVSWGLAEEAAFAARWLAERGLDWAEPLLARCEARVSADMTVESTGIRGAALCPLRVGAFIADAGLGPHGLEVRDVAVPLLLLPFLARAEAPGPVAVRLGTGARVWFAAGQLHGTEGLAALPGIAAVTISPGVPTATAVDLLPRPRPVAAAVAQGLSAFERRTYVPASAQSRLAGAGAGLSDND
jgi:Protein of unknown function (DUF3726)